MKNITRRSVLKRFAAATAAALAMPSVYASVEKSIDVPIPARRFGPGRHVPESEAWRYVIDHCKSEKDALGIVIFPGRSWSWIKGSLEEIGFPLDSVKLDPITHDRRAWIPNNFGGYSNLLFLRYNEGHQIEIRLCDLKASVIYLHRIEKCEENHACFVAAQMSLGRRRGIAGQQLLLWHA